LDSVFRVRSVPAGAFRPVCARHSAFSADPIRSMARPLVAQVNLSALAANLARVREKAPRTQVLAVVKANAYGHGLARVLPALEDADGLALVELDAAVQLRELHYTRRILLLEGFFEAVELKEIAQRRGRSKCSSRSTPE
jgi:alanine racemase